MGVNLWVMINQVLHDGTWMVKLSNVIAKKKIKDKCQLIHTNSFYTNKYFSLKIEGIEF